MLTVRDEQQALKAKQVDYEAESASAGDAGSLSVFYANALYGLLTLVFAFFLLKVGSWTLQVLISDWDNDGNEYL